MKAENPGTLGALAVAGVALAGCAEIAHRAQNHLPERAEPITPGPESRLASRLGFGPCPGQIEQIKKLGQEGYIEQQLAAKQPEPLILMSQLRRLDIYQFQPVELLEVPDAEVIRQLNQAALLRAIYSPNQLQERMVDFWTNHFNISAKKAFGAFYMTGDQKSVIRTNALGSFPAMLAASSKSPAMLEYLDNQVNKKGRANENYAREIMELHTLGVNSGYTQQDVHELARCLTGWTVEKRAFRMRGTFRYQDELHDKTAKVVLGENIPAGGGLAEGERLVANLATHPWTANHLARKLCVYFLGARHEDLEKQMVAAFLKSKGNITDTLRPMLASKEFRDGPGAPQRPLDYMVAALRRTGAVTNAGKPLQDHLASMGQPLYQWPMPDGYPNGADHWQGSLLARWNFAYALCYGTIKGTRVPVDELGHAFSAQGEALVHALTGIGEKTLALALSAPEMNWR